MPPKPMDEKKGKPCFEFLWFNRHDYCIPDKLPDTFGVFGGMKILKCCKCPGWKMDESVTKRLKRNGLL